ncbi:hypothetical protein E9531_06565 [Lampropedia puyangensis]|uniref:Uncharacterized protein n=1 Tax=Lampropedia puyangensis TaxID=1330072 RepID=A0A4S8F786_9BURK|nr:tetratricopeptide repeat protein [Lampropedia puyangensis]THU02761.1 hypothetical protein E9531_06565 [Lampropedia puyangensis]
MGQPYERVVKMAFIAIALVCIAVYCHGLGNGLVFDDRRLSDGTVMDAYGGLWPFKQRLLSYGSFVWIAHIFGEDNFLAQRIFNLMLHVATAIVVGLLSQALLNQWLKEAALRAPQSELDAVLDKRLSVQELSTRARVAWVVAVGWFALNPVAVYAAGYLIQRSIVMATMFTALACWAWVYALQQQQSGRSRGWGWMILALVSALMAFLSKEHAVLVPALAVPLYVYVKRPSAKSLLLVLVGAVVAVALLSAVLWSRFGQILGAAAFDETSGAYVRELAALQTDGAAGPFVLSIFNQAKLFFFYLGYWLVPDVTSMSIDMRPEFPLSWSKPITLCWMLAFIAFVLASIWALLKRRDGWSLFGLCVLCATVLFGTEFATTWIQDPFVLYRSYLWAIFLPPGMAMLWTVLPRKAILLLGGGILFAMAALSYHRLTSFKSEYTVWDDAADKIDQSASAQAFGRWRPFMNRGAYYLEQGEGNAQLALDDFDHAVRLGEPLGSALFSRGMALQLLGKYPESVQAFHQAEQKGFQDTSLYYQAAVSLRSMNAAQNAVAAIEQGLNRNPDAVMKEHLILLRAEIYSQAGAHAQAAKEYADLLQLVPESGKYLVGLGMAWMAQGNKDKALEQFNRAISLRDDSAAYFARGLLQMRMGDGPVAALADVEKAVALAPQNQLYRQALASLRNQTSTTVVPQLGPLRQLER